MDETRSPDGGPVQPRIAASEMRPRTRLVHAGSRRSQFGETSEALYLTQGFLYDDAEAAEARFKGEMPAGEEGFI